MIVVFTGMGGINNFIITVPPWCSCWKRRPRWMGIRSVPCVQTRSVATEKVNGKNYEKLKHVDSGIPHERTIRVGTRERAFSGFTNQRCHDSLSVAFRLLWTEKNEMQVSSPPDPMLRLRQPK